MKCRLDADATVESVTFNMGINIDYKDRVTHLVTVDGYLSHAYLWKKEEKQPFSITFHADEEEASFLRQLLEKHLGRAFEIFPKED